MVNQNIIDFVIYKFLRVVYVLIRAYSYKVI
jgi:hypothetical protein